jgi:prevent-host-death family protein
MSWPVYHAKARFSEFLETTLKDGPQVLTRRGVETAVLVSMDDWKRLQGNRRPNIKEILLDPSGPHDLYIPPRRRLRFSEPLSSPLDDQD